MLLTHRPDQNHLLGALPLEEYKRLAEHLELVSMPLGKMLYHPGEMLSHAYFPTTSIVSLHYVTESGASAESAGVGNEGVVGIALFMGGDTTSSSAVVLTAESAGVGNEGVVGIALFMGGDTTSSSAVVLTAGYAYRLPSRVLKAEFQRGGVLHKLLLRYTQALFTQMSQTAACNRHHLLEQQLCRWLLLTLDRLPTGDLVITQELIAHMFGVRREGITQAIGKLQRTGVISCRRGHISVLERCGLEAATCECYAVVKKESARLLSDFQYHHRL